ncbi:putative zinc-binding protein [Thiomonas sp.]|uniref:putative zinc-binding protein n=1 Tax=Thiomonas sp. TaxID=2047785 RepID=UPI002631659B|nr:putative zinc-binding protein [Thiomonas sp.]
METNKIGPRLPLVYACSGCSSVAQMANHLAVRVDREGLAEMSCIAGIGGNVPSIVMKLQRAAREGRPVLAIDGCALSCARQSIRQRGAEPTVHLRLDLHGVRKRHHVDFDPVQADELHADVVRVLAEMSGSDPSTEPRITSSSPGSGHTLTAVKVTNGGN